MKLLFFISLAGFALCVTAREVSIFYSTWFPDLWSNSWATPQLGFYRSDDLNVIDQHTEWLVDAGVDYVLFDWTNNCNRYRDGNLGIDHLEDATLVFAQRQKFRQ